MVKTIQVVGGTILMLAMIDLLILFVALTQITLEGETGYWNSFWRAQAEFVIKIIN